VVVDADVESKRLPALPEPVAAVMAECGKAKQTTYIPVVPRGDGTPFVGVPVLGPAEAEAVKAIVADYRARMKEIVERAGLPHDLAPAAEIREQSLGVLAGPRKPALEAAFKPMGYTCRGGSGQFHLTRRTAANLTAELYLDVGTWSHSVSGFFKVHGMGFQATLGVPVTLREIPHGQYPIGDAGQWQKIVENLAAVVRELDRSFVPDIERVTGPAPAWYQPAS